MPTPIFYVTSNPGKFEEASHIFAPIPLERIALDLEEIQDTPEKILAHKAKQALSIVNAPLIVDDVSLSCPAIGGLPGPYIKEFLHRLGEEGFANLILKYPDPSVTVHCYIAYIAPGLEPIFTTGSIQGTIVLPRGKLKHSALSWNTIVQLNGYTKTFGEMDMAEHAKTSMRYLALKQLKSRLHEI